MKTGFVTCVHLGLQCMEAIYAVGGELDLAISLQDNLASRKSGRVHLDDFATQHRIPLLKCQRINDPVVIEAIRKADLDWLFIIGWSQIAGEAVLNSTRHGVIGMHPTLLPNGRGRASIPWAILKGLKETGVSMFVLDRGVDTGPILAQERIQISESETATSLYEKVTRAHVALIKGNWAALAKEELGATPQDERLATYWPGRRPADGEFAPGRMLVQDVDRLVRALTLPYPGAFTHLPDGRRLIVWSGVPDCRNPRHVYHLNCIDGLYCPTEYTFSSGDTSERRLAETTK